MPIAELDNISIFYEIHGAGPPLLLIAGLASDSQSWQSIIPALARNHLVIIPDNRGVGRSTQTGIDISIDLMADDCVALLDHLGISAAHMLGHSMGGFVALACALRHSQYFSSLTLAGTAACNSRRNNVLFRKWADDLETGMDPAAWLKAVYPWLFTRTLLDDPQAMESAIRYAVEYPYPQTATAFRKQVEALAAFDCSYQLEQIHLPTLIIHGSEDLIFPVKESIRTLGQIPRSRTCVVEKAAHSIHLENPGAFVTEVLDFLNIY